MFEAKLAEGYVFKRIVEAIKDLVTDVNLDVSPSGKCSHNFLVTLELNTWAMPLLTTLKAIDKTNF